MNSATVDKAQRGRDNTFLMDCLRQNHVPFEIFYTRGEVVVIKEIIRIRNISFHRSVIYLFEAVQVLGILDDSTFNARA